MHLHGSRPFQTSSTKVLALQSGSTQKILRAQIGLKTDPSLMLLLWEIDSFSIKDGMYQNRAGASINGKNFAQSLFLWLRSNSTRPLPKKMATTSLETVEFVHSVVLKVGLFS